MSCWSIWYFGNDSTRYRNRIGSPENKNMKPIKDKKKKKIKVARAMALSNKSYNIASPGQVAQMAIALKNFIIKNSLSVKIVDRDYVMVEGWQFPEASWDSSQR